MLRRFSQFLLPLLLVGTAAAAQGTPTLTFNADWSTQQSVNPLPPGGTVAIVYDESRLSQCRGTTSSGGPAWSITGYFQLNGGAVQSFWVAGHDPAGGTSQPSITLPAGESGDLALWFEVTSLYGCQAWDSNYGNNYHFNVGAPPSIQFNADWSETVVGTLQRGQDFVVDYELSRLPSCRATYNGMDTWDVAVQYRFDGGAVQEKSVTVVNGYSRSQTPITLTAPAGASSVEMWFKNWDRGSCVTWDSNYGQNYFFSLN